VFSGAFRVSDHAKLAYAAGYLFGLTDDSPDNTFKWLMELETYF